MKEPIILSIETSLDDTCAAVTRGLRVISNVVSSQTSYHADWGGTVPDIAKRLHQQWLPKVVELSLRKAGNPQLTSCRHNRPGLASWSKVLPPRASRKWNLPMIAISHMEDIFSALLRIKQHSRTANTISSRFPHLRWPLS
jgi:N6-L-threonylcarbamoyladenine synthase